MKIKMTNFEKTMFKEYGINKLPLKTRKEIIFMKRFYCGYENDSLEISEKYIKEDVANLINCDIKSHKYLTPCIAGKLRGIECLKTGDYVRGILFQ